MKSVINLLSRHFHGIMTTEIFNIVLITSVAPSHKLTKQPNGVLQIRIPLLLIFFNLLRLLLLITNPNRLKWNKNDQIEDVKEYNFYFIFYLCLLKI